MYSTQLPEPTAFEMRYCQMRVGQTHEYLVIRKELEKELEIVCEKLKDMIDSYLKINRALDNLQ